MFAEEHEIYLVAAYWDEAERRDLDQLPYRVHGVPMQRPAAILRAAAAIGSHAPLQQAYLNSHAMRKAISQAEEHFSPDIVYFNTLRSAQWRRLVRTPKKVIDLDEFRSAYYQIVSTQHRNPLRRAVAAIETSRMLVEEQKICADFNRILVSSPVDISDSLPTVDLVRSPDALTPDEGNSRTELGTGVVFVGRMNYGANIDAIVTFVNSSWPSVVARCPEAELNIVGDAPRRKVAKLVSGNVHVLGRVPDVSPFYRAARVSVIPVTAATGVQMKLIESLRLGVPAVVTPLVARQAGVADGREVLVASTDAEWADAVSLLLEDDGLAASLSEAGAAWAARNYCRSAIRADLFDSLSRL